MPPPGPQGDSWDSLLKLITEQRSQACSLKVPGLSLVVDGHSHGRHNEKIILKFSPETHKLWMTTPRSFLPSPGQVRSPCNHPTLCKPTFHHPHSCAHVPGLLWVLESLRAVLRAVKLQSPPVPPCLFQPTQAWPTNRLKSGQERESCQRQTASWGAVFRASSRGGDQRRSHYPSRWGAAPYPPDTAAGRRAREQTWASPGLGVCSPGLGVGGSESDPAGSWSPQ